jgi:L-2-hydroxyglutarate oxidase LhgO
MDVLQHKVHKVPILKLLSSCFLMFLAVSSLIVARLRDLYCACSRRRPPMEFKENGTATNPTCPKVMEKCLDVQNVGFC